MAKPTIDLACMPHDVMFVIGYASGVVYRNQVGGVICLQAEIEGVLAAVDFSSVDVEQIMNLSYKPGSGLDSKIADELDSILSANPRARFLKVDRARLHESSEAWVFVLADTRDTESYTSPPEYCGAVFGFGGARGVLTWLNSD